jgi:hypothetical protein
LFFHEAPTWQRLLGVTLAIAGLGAALIDAMPASIEKITAGTSDLRTDGIST